MLRGDRSDGRLCDLVVADMGVLAGASKTVALAPAMLC